PISLSKRLEAMRVGYPPQKATIFSRTIEEVLNSVVSGLLKKTDIKEENLKSLRVSQVAIDEVAEDYETKIEPKVMKNYSQMNVGLLHLLLAATTSNGSTLKNAVNQVKKHFPKDKGTRSSQFGINRRDLVNILLDFWE